MTMNRLIACGACARHLRATEPACPFCGAALPELAPEAPRRVPGRIGRAAILAFGATLSATSLGACVAAYGSPTFEDAGPADDAGADGGGVAPAYGAPGP
jgi:hypothetical protein